MNNINSSSNYINNGNGNTSAAIFGSNTRNQLDEDEQPSSKKDRKESRTRVKGQGNLVFSPKINNGDDDRPKLALSPKVSNNSNSVSKSSVLQFQDEVQPSDSGSSSLIVNYAYTPSSSSGLDVVDHSGICDLGFRNLEKFSKLTKEDFKPLSEKYFDKLSLSHNALKRMPHYFFSTFPKLEMLLVLDLSCNQLSFLPNDLDHLKSLTHLNLFLNKLRCLPPSLGRLENLKWLNIARNPELFKFSYLKKLTGPMLTEKQCFECATNVKKWINAVVTRRAAFESSVASASRGGLSAVKYEPELAMDEQLIRFYPSNPAQRIRRVIGDQNMDFTFIDEEDSDEVSNSGDALQSQKIDTTASPPFPMILTKWVITLWISSIILVLLMSTIIAPFALNEKSRRIWTSRGLLTIPEFLVDAAIYIGRGLHDALGGLPCKLFLQKNCKYCYPHSPGFSDLVLWRWLGYNAG